MLSENIKKIRINKGLGLNETARKAGISGSYLSDIENGKKENPTVTTLTKIADALEVPLDYLTRKSARAMIEDKLEELNVTFEELSDKTKIPTIFFDKLDDIIPDEGDYEKIQIVAHTLKIEPVDLVNALHRQVPPITEEKLDEWDNKYKNLKEWDNSLDKITTQEEKIKYLESIVDFADPKDAVKFLLKQPAIMGFGGFDANKMTDDEIIEFANELLRQLKLISYKFKK